LRIVLLEERQHMVIEQIGHRDGHLAVVELGKAYLGVGVDEGLLVDAPNALQIADIERMSTPLQDGELRDGCLTLFSF
jgi:hypothetical protein